MTTDQKEKIVTPYGNTGKGKKAEVASMFDNISHRYDFLNHFLSMGIDRKWRKKTINMFRKSPPRHLLDIATGTGDLAIEALSLNPEHITGVDISDGMLEEGRKKISNLGLQSIIDLKQGDSENLEFNNETFDGVMVAFGVRNFENLDRGLSEMYRVLKPGGRCVILEFSIPRKSPFRQLYNLYFRFILPKIGKLVSGDHSAYAYLPASVQSFPDGREFIQHLDQAGFKDTSAKELTFGIASIYSGTKQ